MSEESGDRQVYGVVLPDVGLVRVCLQSDADRIMKWYDAVRADAELGRLIRSSLGAVAKSVAKELKP